ncbi:MAG TPA: ATP-binding protein [Erysipelotrichaceae bacterium]|nr:ATP-binding protein [Erysipelotrichaceae bacterium]
MNYLKRKIDEYLINWKNDPDKKPLIVRGARQVGKTESIKRFASKYYENVININFVEEPVYKNIFADGYKTSDIIKNISRIDTTKRFTPYKTLLFFDELQDFPDMATALKFFKIDGRFDVICSGSLLGLNYKKIESNSVGYKIDYEMTSLDFEEFLWANGYSNDVIEDMLKHMCELRPFNDVDMVVFNNLFLDYCILGGMPSVVSLYIENKTFEKTFELQKQLIQDYKEDIRKYVDGLDQTRILNVFNHVAPQLAKENKKFQITKVAKGARFSNYKGCIEWLKDSGIVNICYGMNFPELPLKGNYDENKYKLYFFDTGLLVAQLDEESHFDLRANKNLGVYKGALYENIVAEALVKQGYSLYYYKREDSSLEQDFFVRDIDSLIPIEVKATSGSAKSLNVLITSDKYPDIKYGIKFTKGNIGYSRKIYTFPYFCSFLLKRYLYSKMK